MLSLLHLVNSCDNFRPNYSTEKLVRFYPSPSSDENAWIGLLKPAVVAALVQDNETQQSENHQAPWHIQVDVRVSFESWLDTPSKKSAVMKRLCESWRASGVFAEQIGGRLWRDEPLPVYYSPFTPLDSSNIAFVMERAACPLFGVVQFGVHLTIYTPDFKIWVPRRSETKQTLSNFTIISFPGFLDNTVAGGIPHGLSPLEALFKEAMEEASLPEDLIKPHIKCAGGISYFFQSRKGWLKPEYQHVYDLCLPSSEQDSISKFTPKPLDGEVESFELYELSEVISKLRAGEFKPNCALVLIDFLIRHGHLHFENEPHFLEILTRIHGRFGYP